MRCLVTGGEGFIGKHVASALSAAGHRVSVIDVSGDAIKVDICDREALLSMFKELRPEAVFHLAAVADARDALANPTKTVQINIGGTASVLDSARQTKVGRVILASTCWVANAMGSGVLDETSPFLADGGGHVYTTTKIASELLVHDFAKLYGQPFTILRYGIPYGPGMWAGLVLKNFLDQAFAGKPLRIFGDGSASRRFVYVEDLARAHVAALQNVAVNQVYNLEGMRFVTVRELADLVSKLLDGVEIQYVEEPNRIGSFHYFRKLISNNKAYIDLGWAPEVDLEDGVRRTIEWYKREVLAERARSAVVGIA